MFRRRSYSSLGKTNGLDLPGSPQRSRSDSTKTDMGIINIPYCFSLAVLRPLLSGSHSKGSDSFGLDERKGIDDVKNRG